MFRYPKKGPRLEDSGGEEREENAKYLRLCSGIFQPKIMEQIEHACERYSRADEWFSAQISRLRVQRGAYDIVQTALSPAWYSAPSHGVPQMCKYE
jgi:hypothetical protein